MYYICSKQCSMKQLSKLAFALLVVLFSTYNAEAKKSVRHRDLELKGGLNFENMHGEGSGTSYNVGGHAGISAGVRDRFLGLQGELVVSTAKYNYSNPGSSSTLFSIKNVYLNVPLLVEARLYNNLWLQVGPQYTFLLNSKYESGGKTDFFNPGAFSGVIGAQLFLPYNLACGARYVFGLGDWNVHSGSNSDNSWKMRSMQLFIAFRLK